MATHLTIPCKCNSVRFYPEQNPVQANFLSKQFDNTSFIDGQQQFQTRIAYEQKQMLQDRITLLFYTQYNGDDGGSPERPPYLEILDKDKNRITNDITYVGYKGTQLVANGDYTPHGSATPIQVTASLWSFTFGSLIESGTITSNGIYYLRLWNYPDDLYDAVSFLSEPILLFENAPETLYVNSSVDYNKNDIITNGWDGDYFPTFATRVEAYIEEYKPVGLNIGYLQSDYDQLQYFGQSWRTFKFSIGNHYRGVPDYMLERINKLFELDNVSIDGKQFILDIGTSKSSDGTSRWKKNKIDASPLGWSSTTIREKYDNENAFVQNNALLFTIPATYPYAISSFAITDGVSATTIPEFVIYNDDDFSSFLAYLNDTIAPSDSLLGSFAVGGGKLYYINGEGETYSLDASFNNPNTFGENIPLTDYLQYWIIMEGVFPSFNVIDITKKPKNSKVVRDTGRVSTFPYSIAGYYTATSGTTISPSILYSDNRLNRVTLFYNNTIDILSLTQSGNVLLAVGDTAGTAYAGNGILNISGKLPNTLTEFYFIGCKTMDSYATKINLPLGSAAETLEIIKMGMPRYYTGYYDCPTPPDGFMNGIPLPNLVSFTLVSVSGVTSYVSDSVVNAIGEFFGHEIFGTVYLANTDCVTVCDFTAASLAARTLLGFEGWTLTAENVCYDRVFGSEFGSEFE